MADRGDPRSRADLPYRIRIGVTGSAATGDPEATLGKLRQSLPQVVLELLDKESRGLLGAARHTPIAFSVLTTLGSEAERLLARAVLQFPDGAIQAALPELLHKRLAPARLQAVIPSGEDVYLEMFPSLEERKAVAELLMLDRLPVVIADDPARANVDARAAARRRQRRLAKYIVDRCDVVIALQDRRTSTAELPPLAEYAVREERPLITVWADAPQRPSPQPGRGLNAQAVVRLEMFNALAVTEVELAKYVNNAYAKTFDNPEGRQVTEARKAPVRDHLLPYYARASLLAKENQKSYRRAGQAVWILFPLAIAAVATGTLFPGLGVVAFATELAILVAILFIVWQADRTRSLEKWVECRFFAERIRGASYLAAAGVEVSPLDVPPHMGGPAQRGDWTVMAFNEIWEPLRPLAACTEADWELLRRFVQQQWIAEQRGHHEKKARDSESLSRRLERAGRAVFALAMVAALVHLVLAGRFGHFGLVGDALIFLGIMLPGVGAAIGGFRAHREYSRLAKRSQSMAAALADLERDFAEIGDPGELARELSRTERLMLSEVQDWLLLMRFAGVAVSG